MSTRLTKAELEAVIGAVTEYLFLEVEAPPEGLYETIRSALAKLETQYARRVCRNYR